MKLFICGFPGSGKDTVADILKEYNFINLKFASGLYKVAHETFGMPIGAKDRKLLQNIGGFARSIDKDYWIKQLVLASREQTELHRNVIVTDCRFLNEYTHLSDCGFTGLYINADEKTCIDRMIRRDGSAQLSTLSAPSEQEHKLFCHKCIKIDNNGTIEQLKENVVALYIVLSTLHKEFDNAAS